MLKTRSFKLAFTVTALLIITMALVGCGNKNEPAQSTTAREGTQVNSKNTAAGNLSDTGKTASAEIKMDAKMKEKLDTFFSNFSEANVQPFEKGNIDDANLIRFGVKHVILNNAKLIEHKGDENYGYIKAADVDGADLYFWGVKPKKHATIEDYTYKEGYYGFPMASGEGPMKMMPASRQAWAKAAFSDRKP